MQTRFIALAALVTACAGTPKPVAGPTPHDHAVEALVGSWAGHARGTPFGDFPMAIAFDRDGAGVHGRLDNGQGMYLDFRFQREAGRWLLVEEGAIPGAGTQHSTLAPVAAAGAPRWADRADPSRLAVAFAVDADTLTMTTTLHGAPHAVFELRRVQSKL
jgi:hypothetical protein